MTLCLRAVERFLLPNGCVVCDELVSPADPDALVCHRCRARLKPLLGGCPRCRQPLPPVGGCRFCLSWPRQLAWVRSAVWFDHEARAIVHYLKYRGYHRLADLAADVMVRHLPVPREAILVPVPLSARRLRSRGYNQAALLAAALARRWSLPVREDLLTRPLQRGSQTALTPQERMANVRAAFAAGRGGPRGTEQPQLVLVDDVLTTGATVCAAAAALGTAGWRWLGAVTFARALPVERRVIETPSS